MPESTAPARHLAPVAAVLPTYESQAAPAGLATRRQLRAMNLSPGGHDPVAQLRCRHCATRPNRECTRMAWLYRIDLAKPKRMLSLAQEEALDKAMAARQTCPSCRRRYTFVLPLRTIGCCAECHDGTPAAPDTFTAPTGVRLIKQTARAA